MAIQLSTADETWRSDGIPSWLLALGPASGVSSALQCHHLTPFRATEVGADPAPTQAVSAEPF